MSVKTMLPILGVGSAFAILGLAAARRQAKHTRGERLASRERHRPSGVQPRVVLHEADDAELAAAAPELTSDFWDASPESYSLVQSYGRPLSEVAPYDALDPEDLSAEWLTRATEAPIRADLGRFDVDDPAEIPADSVSMISDASRHAATLDLVGIDEDNDSVDSRL